MNNWFRLRSEGLEWRQVEGEIIALDVATSRYLSVNRTGAVLWSDLATGASREDLVSRLVDEFGVDRETATEHLDAFLGSLAEENLLE